MTNPIDIEKASSELLNSERTKIPIERLTDRYAQITVDDAYHIQLAQIESKVNEGSRIVGKKIGLTSEAMQQMFNVSEPDYGHLLDYMMHVDGDTIPIDDLISPKLEFEIAFVLKKDLKGPGVTMTDVINATAYVAPAFEVIDSRIKDWQIRFEDTVADNGSSAKAIVGGVPTPIDEVDLQHIGMVVEKNGEQIATAAGAAVMGNPTRAVAWLANALGKYDISLLAGEVVLSGALTAAVDIEQGDSFTAQFDHIGTVTVHF